MYKNMHAGKMYCIYDFLFSSPQHSALVSVKPMSCQMLKEVSPQHPVTIQQVK